MGRGATRTPIPPANDNLYPQQLQLKLYQAFIFSIPILFSIILFILFYLFYLKRRTLSILSSQPPSPSPSQPLDSNHQATSSVSSPWYLGLKGDLIKEKLQVVQFDEELRAKDSLCCVCLGEFEIEEELRQVPSCKHVFHYECIQSWLRNNATCPLCRCPVLMVSFVVKQLVNPQEPPRLAGGRGGSEAQFNHQGVVRGGSVVADSTGGEELVLQIGQSNRTMAYSDE